MVFAQSNENQLYYALKHSVKTGKIDEYRNLMSQLTEAYEKYNYPFTFSGWQSLIANFYYFYPVDDYNQVENLFQEAWKIIPELGEGFVQEFNRTIESWDDFFIRSIDSLSYNPENTTDLGLVYAEWRIRYYASGEGMKYFETSKLVNETYKKINYDYPVSIFQGDIGMNRPNFFSVFWGKNPPDLYAHQRNSWENFDSELKNRIGDNSATRKFEIIPFWYQEDLSYSPE
jgi:hypothetical protein